MAESNEVRIQLKPEELPIEEDIKKLERKIKSLDKDIAKKNLKK